MPNGKTRTKTRASGKPRGEAFKYLQPLPSFKTTASDQWYIVSLVQTFLRRKAHGTLVDWRYQETIQMGRPRDVHRPLEWKLFQATGGLCSSVSQRVLAVAQGSCEKQRTTLRGGFPSMVRRDRDPAEQRTYPAVPSDRGFTRRALLHGCNQNALRHIPSLDPVV